MDHLVELVDRWRAQGVQLVPAANAAEVREAFQAASSEATPDVIALYTTLGGMQSMDKEFWRLWSLDEIKSENAEPSPDGVLFSDYLIASWCFRLKRNSDNTSSVLVDYFDGSGMVQVARTLSEFVCLYWADATRLVDPASHR
uniref:hypothetical protein n=1 Tax=unclassified Variovorax TaxID=663243 RepID=UPI001052565D